LLEVFALWLELLPFDHTRAQEVWLTWMEYQIRIQRF